MINTKKIRIERDGKYIEVYAEDIKGDYNKAQEYINEEFKYNSYYIHKNTPETKARKEAKKERKQELIKQQDDIITMLCEAIVKLKNHNDQDRKKNFKKRYNLAYDLKEEITIYLQDIEKYCKEMLRTK